MNWLQRLFVKAASPVFRFAPRWMRWAFLPVSWRRLLEGYQKNSAVAACVTTLAFSFPEPPLMAGHDQDGRFVPDYKHKIMELIRQPNPDMGEVELHQFAVTYAAVGGSCYLWKQRNADGMVIHLWPFSEATMHALPGRSTEEGLVRAYEYDPGDGQVLEIPKKDVIQWKWMPDPEQPWRGIGALEFAMREVDRDSEASTFVYALLKNNAVPPVVITLAEGDDFTPEKADRLRKEWKVKYSGEEAGNVGFIEFGMKAEKMGFNLQELAAEALNSVPEARIAAAFRVPPVVAGLSVGLKRSDYGDQAARRSFTELTLAALWRSFASELYNGLKDEFVVQPNFTLQFDIRKVRALQEEETKIWERVTLAFDRSVLTRKEAKEFLGIEPVAGDEVYKVSLATEFVPADGDGVVSRTQEAEGSGQEAGGGAEEEGGGKQKAEGGRQEAGGGEGRQKAAAVARVLLRIRNDAANRMKTAVDVYFSQLADRVVERAGGGKQKAEGGRQKAEGGRQAAGGSEQKAGLPNAGDLLNADDRKKLEDLVKRFYVQVIELSWETWNVALGVEMAFDLSDMAVTRALRMADMHVKDIQSTVLDALREALKYGSENGWGVDQLVRGDAVQRGLREIITEVQKDYARTVARSELGQAQNAAAAERYRQAGVEKVEILDGGAADSAPACGIANGQIWTVDLLDANRLQHPNCSRCPAPYFGDEEPMTDWPYPFGDRGE